MKIKTAKYGFILSLIILNLIILNITTISALTITETIVVGAGSTYDGGGQTIYAQGMGDGSQAEDQDPIFRLENGATLRNVRIGAPGCDGVHCYGNNTVENVVWEDVGEDALTVKGGESTNVGTITVTGGSATSADDKVFQINAPCTFKVSNFTANNFGKVIRQNGGTTFQVIIYIENCTFSNGSECIARTDSTSTQLYYSNMTVTNVPDLWLFPSDSQIHEETSGTPVPPATPAPTPNPVTLYTGVTTAIQAEDAFFSNAAVETEHAGYTGSGYVNFTNEPGGYIDWNVSISSSTQTTCVFLFANGGDAGRPVDISVNGSVAASNVSFPATTDWTNWSSLSVNINLGSGTNVIRFTGTGSEGGPNVDRMDITPGGITNPTPVPALAGDVNASGSVDIVDALLIAQYYVGLSPTPFYTAAADTNCDGSINIVDALLIAQYYVGLVQQLDNC